MLPRIVRTLSALKKAVNMFIVIAWALAALAFLIHVVKWLSNWFLCFWAMCGKICPNNLMDASITATPRGKGPGGSNDWKEHKKKQLNKTKLIYPYVYYLQNSFSYKQSEHINRGWVAQLFKTINIIQNNSKGKLKRIWRH